MDLRDFMYDLVNDGRYIRDFTPHGFSSPNGFFLLDGWDDVREVNKIIKEAVEKEGIEIPEKYKRDTDDCYFEWVCDELGCEWDFSDNFFICDECRHPVPYESGGTVNYWITPHGDRICEDCVKRDYIEDYVESLIDNPDSANVFLSEDELNAMGWTKLDENYENGYYGQEDDPKTILKKIKADKPDCRVIFSIECCNPFAINFSTYIKGE